MTVPAAPEYRAYPVLTLPVFDLRAGDVVHGTDSEVVRIDAENPWTRRLTERHPTGQITHFTYDCADELTVYRKPEAGAAATPGAESTPGERTGRLVGIRCPHCSNERAFVVQITVDVVLDAIGSASSLVDHAVGRIVDPQDGFRGDQSVLCHPDRGGCGHRGTVDEFRIPEGDVTGMAGRPPHRG